MGEKLDKLKDKLEAKKVKKVSIYFLSFFIPLILILRNIYIFKSISFWK